LLAFGGCYSNLQATEALLAQAARLGVAPENIVCTGDIIAYGADAAATLQLVRDAGIHILMGNCEESLAKQANDCGCGFAPGSACDVLAERWYAHAMTEVDDEDRRYMAALPREIEVELDEKVIRFVHGNLDRINAFVFPSVSNLELERQLQIAVCDAVVAGHSGIPFTRRIGRKIWHNAGSIGMPANDGTPRGWFSILSVEDGEIIVDQKPLDYDFAQAASAMRRNNLPEGYAAALETGIWPSLDILPAADRYFTGISLESRAIVEAPPEFSLGQLTTLWVNTGSQCNLSCTKCFMESTPTNDSLSYFPLLDLREILAFRPSGLMEIGFTGGEPFMNPDIIPMIVEALAAGCQVLVLTNAMRPLQRHEGAMRALIERHPRRVHVRVSLDHYEPVQHEALRGKASFASSIAGLKFLSEAGAIVSVASRTPWGETEAMIRAGFARLFAAKRIALDAQNPAELILFPEMDEAGPWLPVTMGALAAVPLDKPIMCKASRMVVRRKGAGKAEFTPCTLLPNVSLTDPYGPVTLNHPHCAQFCVYGGASCAGAPG
jgi:predicted phosphodiesterase/pyruvate-formate lyase-activating enzyme